MVICAHLFLAQYSQSEQKVVYNRPVRVNDIRFTKYVKKRETS